MSAASTKKAGLVTNHPRSSLAVLAAVTMMFIYGSTLLAPQAGNDAFLPADSEVARSTATLNESFRKM